MNTWISLVFASLVNAALYSRMGLRLKPRVIYSESNPARSPQIIKTPRAARRPLAINQQATLRNLDHHNVATRKCTACIIALYIYPTSRYM